jgi:tetratricopeptide (TPR) repeat protein
LRDSLATARVFATFERLSPAQRLVDHYRRKLAEYPDHAAAPYLLGRAYHEQGRLQLAEQNYAMALALDPTYADALHGAGRLLQDRGQLLEAANAYEAARKKNPELPNIDNELGQIYHHQRRFDLAVSAYRRGLDRITDRAAVPTLLANLAMALAMSGQLDDAKGAFERSLELDPEQIDTRGAFAQVLMAMGDAEAAAAQWQEVLRRQPNHQDARQRLQQMR